MNKKDEMTFSFYVSVGESPPEDIFGMNEDKRKEIFNKLGQQYIKNGLHGKIVTA